MWAEIEESLRSRWVEEEIRLKGKAKEKLRGTKKRMTD